MEIFTEQPANEKTIIRISPSSMDNYQKCARYFHYTNIQNLEPISKSSPMEKGSFIHKILEDYYKLIIAGVAKDEAHQVAFQNGRDAAVNLELPLPETEHVLNTFTEYHKRYYVDNWQPIFAEQAFSVVLYEDDTTIVLLEGKIDLCVKIPPDDTIIIVDHKSGDRNYNINSMSTQFMLYCIALDTTQMIRNFVGFQKDPTLRFNRKLIAYNRSVLEEWKQYYIYYAMRIKDSLTTNFYPPNSKNCYFCPYADVCSSPEDSREWKLSVNFKKRDKHDLFAEKVMEGQ